MLRKDVSPVAAKGGQVMAKTFLLLLSYRVAAFPPHRSTVAPFSRKFSTMGNPEIEKKIEKLAATTISQRDYKWRQKALQQVSQMITKHEELWLEALEKDLGKPPMQGIVTEVNALHNELNYQLKNMKSWMRPQRVPSQGALWPIHSTITQVPLGKSVLVIAPFNYPLLLALWPTIGSLAAGNPTLIKPSELAIHTSALLEKLVPQYLDESVMTVMPGDKEITTLLLQYSWSKVVFTGSNRVGRIVATACAQTLTGCILELGGKSPLIVDDSVKNWKSAASRIIWAKLLNGGQTCVAPDYLLVDRKVANILKTHLLEALQEQKPHEYSMITSVHAERMKSLLKGVNVLCGGAAQIQDRSVPPTIIWDCPLDSDLLKDEIFGPLLPVLIYDDKTQACQWLQQISDMPLALYVFTRDTNSLNQWMEACPSSAVVHNDAVVHLGSPTLPLGGRGASGYGAYKGRYSFESLSHSLVQVHRPLGFEFGNIRYPPYDGGWKEGLLRVALKLPLIPSLFKWWQG